MQIKQAGACAICLKNKKLNIDHDHASGKVRGLLCRNCNVGLGHFDDSIEALQSAIDYLARHIERID